MTAPSDPIVAAWQAALAAEHAAIYGYGELGPVLDAPLQPLARTDQQLHRGLRDASATTIAGFGVTPVASRAAYPAPFPLTDPAAGMRLAVELEDRCAAAWRYVIAAGVLNPLDRRAATARKTGQARLTASAIRALQWRSRVTPSDPTVAFPGL